MAISERGMIRRILLCLRYSLRKSNEYISKKAEISYPKAKANLVLRLLILYIGLVD